MKYRRCRVEICGEILTCHMVFMHGALTWTILLLNGNEHSSQELMSPTYDQARPSSFLRVELPVRTTTKSPYNPATSSNRAKRNNTNKSSQRTEQTKPYYHYKRISSPDHLVPPHKPRTQVTTVSTSTTAHNVYNTDTQQNKGRNRTKSWSCT